ncbi:hypothetical protein L596_008137 [Steinernema carpocapsae]|uniref:Uncharacterized protein n=1 Tax=Steinernema carpocapsae TaxID=34508 RepID=A0A4U5PC32_STECR|nr:hypothetical protein L596_008137 [Steinernema carpocapsae]
MGTREKETCQEDRGDAFDVGVGNQVEIHGRGRLALRSRRRFLPSSDRLPPVPPRVIARHNYRIKLETKYC